jgi:dTDP-4-amino-4,6-dideoxygalactose transaminase
VIRVPRRDELKTYLADRGVECKVHYRQPVYRLPHYLARSGRDPGPRPVTDRLAREMITLPSHPAMGAGVDEIVDMIAEFYATTSGES